MRWISRLGLCLIAVSALAACSDQRARSRTPLVTPAEAAKGAALKPGLWLEAIDGCPFDPLTPRGAWPDCAQGLIVRPAELTDISGREPQRAEPYLLGVGAPRPLQSRTTEEGRTIYRFGGVRPLSSDATGRIVAFQRWAATCGETPEHQVDSKGDRKSLCVAKSRSALEGLLAESEKGNLETFVWLREAEQ